MSFIIDPERKTPLYRQIIRHFEEGIRSGEYPVGQSLPSMNVLAAETGISKETVKKSYNLMCRSGLIVPKQGKGFYVNDRGAREKVSVLILFDRINAYKQVTLDAFAEALGGKAEITILLHNQNLDLLEYYLDRNLDRYDYYLVTPHFPLDAQTQQRAALLLRRIPNRKLIMLDHWMQNVPGNYPAIYQDFDNDAASVLEKHFDDLRGYERLHVITLRSSLYGERICRSIDSFCQRTEYPVEFLSEVPKEIQTGTVYFLLNSQLDSGLAALARSIRENHLEIGSDVGIISYNEDPLNELVLGGLTTMSTDFHAMGLLAAEMILGQKSLKVHCDFRLIRRLTF